MKFITLPCGCRINETTVDAMCGAHAQQLRYEKAKQESGYRNLLDEQMKMASSPVRRSDDPSP